MRQSIRAFAGAIFALSGAGVIVTQFAAADSASAQRMCPYSSRPVAPIKLSVPPPAEARRLGLSGEVFVLVDVDASGSATYAIATGWSDPMFIEPATAAARSVRYSPLVLNCVPVASNYTGTIPITAPRQPERIDVVQFFEGAWTCDVSGRETWRRVPGGLERVPASTGEEYVGGHWKPVGPPAEDYVRDRFGGWVLRRDGKIVARAHPWMDERWTFFTGEQPDAGLVQFAVEGKASFVRTTASARERIEERCARDAPKTRTP